MLTESSVRVFNHFQLFTLVRSSSGTQPGIKSSTETSSWKHMPGSFSGSNFRQTPPIIMLGPLSGNCYNHWNELLAFRSNRIRNLQHSNTLLQTKIIVIQLNESTNHLILFRIKHWFTNLKYFNFWFNLMNHFKHFKWFNQPVCSSSLAFEILKISSSPSVVENLFGFLKIWNINAKTEIKMQNKHIFVSLCKRIISVFET